MRHRILSTDDLMRIVLAGGGLTLKADGRPTDCLIALARAASVKRTPVTLTGVKTRTPEELIAIAAAGKGAVTFEVE